jgi:hypothetical protein
VQPIQRVHKLLHLVLSCIFSHLLVALVGRQQNRLLLLVVCGRARLAGCQAMQAQLRQTAHEHMQLTTQPFLQIRKNAEGERAVSINN